MESKGRTRLRECKADVRFKAGMQECCSRIPNLLAADYSPSAVAYGPIRPDTRPVGNCQGPIYRQGRAGPSRISVRLRSRQFGTHSHSQSRHFYRDTQSRSRSHRPQRPFPYPLGAPPAEPCTSRGSISILSSQFSSLHATQSGASQHWPSSRRWP